MSRDAESEGWVAFHRTFGVLFAIFLALFVAPCTLCYCGASVTPIIALMERCDELYVEARRECSTGHGPKCRAARERFRDVCPGAAPDETGR